MMRAACIALSALLLLGVWMPAAEGQWLPEPAPWIAGDAERTDAVPTIALAPQTERAPFPRVFGGAVVGLAAGAAASGLAAAVTDYAPPLLITVPVGAGIGAHIANRRQGNLPLAIGATFPVGAIVLPLALMGGMPEGSDLVLFGAGTVLVLGGTPALVEWWSAGR